MSEPKKNEIIYRLIRLKGRLEKELEKIKKTEKTAETKERQKDLEGYIKDITEVLERELKK